MTKTSIKVWVVMAMYVAIEYKPSTIVSEELNNTNTYIGLHKDTCMHSNFEADRVAKRCWNYILSTIEGCPSVLT